MREITYKELNSLHYKILENQAEGQIIDFAKRWFGPNVETIEVENTSEYNDEGGSYLRVDSIYAYDKDHKSLDKLPIKELITNKAVPDYVEVADGDDLDDAVYDYFSDAKSELDARHLGSTYKVSEYKPIEWKFYIEDGK